MDFKDMGYLFGEKGRGISSGGGQLTPSCPIH